MGDEVMKRVWKHTMIRKASWEKCRGPGTSVRLQRGESGMKWPRSGIIVSPGSRSMDFSETSLTM